MNELSKAIRFLSVDMIEKAKSGHPGLPLGMAEAMLVLWSKFISFNPNDPEWPNRDRFVLSAGHGSALLYACLYLTGYKDITIEDIKNFRQLGSKTAGHPEHGLTNGVEATTGPLGQGLANAVGMAIAERVLNARFGNELINHRTWVLASDGDLMEGISQEAISLAGHLKLKNLIVLHDDNKITIDGSSDMSTSECQSMRFLACGWDTYSVDGHNEEELEIAFSKAINSNKPVYISCQTTIAYGAPNKAGSHHAHGSPLGAEEVKQMREVLDWQNDPFDIPENILKKWRSFWEHNKETYTQWTDNFNNAGAELKKYLEKDFDCSDAIIELKKSFINLPTNEASRVSSGRVIGVIVKSLPNLIGGSADLSGSNNTKVKTEDAISCSDYSGSYIHYGIREHAMAAIMNGISLHKGLIPYGGTFLVFSDYMRPAIRLSALSKQQVIYVLTHDSIGLGEDGSTHQPVEHLASLRAIPNLYVFRPCDVIETAECWQIALQLKNSPSVLALSRQTIKQQRIGEKRNGELYNTISQIKECKERGAMPIKIGEQRVDDAIFKNGKWYNLSFKGAYILHETDDTPTVAIFASGSEVEIATNVFKQLSTMDIKVRVISVPCIELFYEQSLNYITSLTQNTLNIVIEAGIRQCWDRILGTSGLFFGVENFGESGSYEKIYQHFNLTADKITEAIQQKLGKS